MEKQYTLFGYVARVTFGEGMVRIANDRDLRRMFGPRPEAAADSLAALVKADYATAYGKPLEVTDDSFVVELWGHLYFDYALVRYKPVLRVVLLFGLYRRFCHSCHVIDCGERGKDPNRHLWDAMARRRQWIARRLPKLTHGW